MPQNQTLLMDVGQGLSLMMGLPTIGAWNTSGRPKKPKMGTIGFNSETNNLEYWNGSYWLAAAMSKLS